jgi:hypothetical protein
MTWTKCLATTAALVLGVVAYAPDAGAITGISACVTITASGSYVLTRNLVATGDCLVVAADFVTIDLAGHLITGNGTGAGIRDSGFRRGIAVYNGSVTNFLAGVRFCGQGSIEILIDRMRVIDNGSDGISLCDGMAVVKDSISSGNSQGIFAGPRSVVRSTTASNNDSIGVQVGVGSTVIGNTADENGNTGLSILEGSTIMNNSARGNAQFGLVVTCPSNVLGNTLTANGPGGATNLTPQGAGVCNVEHNVVSP